MSRENKVRITKKTPSPAKKLQTRQRIEFSEKLENPGSEVSSPTYLNTKSLTNTQRQLASLEQQKLKINNQIKEAEAKL